MDCQDLPLWEFTERELSPGLYEVVAARDGGITGSGSGTDPEALMADLREWARKVDAEVGDRAP